MGRFSEDTYNKVASILDVLLEETPYSTSSKLHPRAKILGCNLGLSNFRKVLTRYRKENSSVSEFDDHCESKGIDKSKVDFYWDKTKRYSVKVRQNIVSYDNIREDLIKELKEYAPKYPKIERKQSKDGHLLVIDPADVHIGKLCQIFESGETYNEKKAVKRVHEGVQGILDKTSGFNIDKILFIAGNDILHTDGNKRASTSGTPQDTSGSWYSNFQHAKRLYIEVLEKLMTVADVHYIHNTSNHDLVNGTLLSDTICSWFHNCDNITFDIDIKHRKYFKWHNNLIGSTHGDGAKTNDLGMLMANESPEWSNAKHRYFYTHHVHHKTSKDLIGCTVESLRSPSASDAWHHKSGYTGVPQAIEGFLHSKNNGQIARITHLF